MAVASLHYEIVNRRGYRATEVKFSCQADAESYLRDEACHLRTALIDEEVKEWAGRRRQLTTPKANRPPLNARRDFSLRYQGALI
jgi:hypothetical protein